MDVIVYNIHNLCFEEGMGLDLTILNQMIADTACPEAAEATTCYLANHLKSLVKRGDRVLICFSNETVGGLGWLMEQAVLRCEGVPVVWGPDYRWKTVLQQAFFSHASVLIAPPLIALGLSKLKKYTGLGHLGCLGMGLTLAC